jgi:nucleoside-diphosphate-sugar epimerase
MIPDLNYLPGSVWKKVSENRNYFLSENPVFAIVCNAAICNRTIAPDHAQKGDMRDTLADNSKAQNSLGWVQKIPVPEGIKHYVTWVKKMER